MTTFNDHQIIGQTPLEVKWCSQKHLPRVLGTEQQSNGHFYAWRKATPSDLHELHAV